MARKVVRTSQSIGVPSSLVVRVSSEMRSVARRVALMKGMNALPDFQLVRRSPRYRRRLTASWFFFKRAERDESVSLVSEELSQVNDRSTFNFKDGLTRDAGLYLCSQRLQIY